MKAVYHDLIQQRAYEIWEQNGRPVGLNKEHWEQAERELLDAAPAIKTKAGLRAPTEAVGHAQAATDAGKLEQKVTGKRASSRFQAGGETARTR